MRKGPSRKAARIDEAKLRHARTALDHDTKPGETEIPGLRLRPLKGCIRGNNLANVPGVLSAAFCLVDSHAAAGFDSCGNCRTSLCLASGLN